MFPRPRNILCPIEFDETFKPAILMAKRIAERNEGKVYLMHAVPPVNDPFVISGALRPHHDLVAAEAKLKAIAEEHLGDIPHEIVLRVGDPVDEVLKAETELGIELVIMPTHKHSQAFRLLMEGVSHKIVQDSICPVTTLTQKAWAHVQ